MHLRLHSLLVVLAACAPAGSDRLDRSELPESSLDPCWPMGTLRRLSDHEIWHRVKCHCGEGRVINARLRGDFYRFRLISCGGIVDIDIRLDGTITSATRCPSTCTARDPACDSPPSFPSPECTPGDAGPPAIVPAASDAGVSYPGWDAGAWSAPDAGPGWEWSWPDAGGWDPWATPDAGPSTWEPWGAYDAGPGWQWESYADAGDSYDEGW